MEKQKENPKLETSPWENPNQPKTNSSQPTLPFPPRARSRAAQLPLPAAAQRARPSSPTPARPAKLSKPATQAHVLLSFSQHTAHTLYPTSLPGPAREQPNPLPRRNPHRPSLSPRGPSLTPRRAPTCPARCSAQLTRPSPATARVASVWLTQWPYRSASSPSSRVSRAPVTPRSPAGVPFGARMPRIAAAAL